MCVLPLGYSDIIGYIAIVTPLASAGKNHMDPAHIEWMCTYVHKHDCIYQVADAFGVPFSIDRLVGYVYLPVTVHA